VNAVELSPLTLRGMAKRITADVDQARSEAALCYLVALLEDVAGGRITSERAADLFRGLALAARPTQLVLEVR
jgi:hypothetical protein